MSAPKTAPTRNKLLRKKVSDRDQGICASCQRFDPHWEADHIVALWEGGNDALENLQTLCRHCHGAKTKTDAPIRAKSDRLRAKDELTKRRRRVAAIQPSGAPFIGANRIE